MQKIEIINKTRSDIPLGKIATLVEEGEKTPGFRINDNPQFSFPEVKHIIQEQNNSEIFKEVFICFFENYLIIQFDNKINSQKPINKVEPSFTECEHSNYSSQNFKQFKEFIYWINIDLWKVKFDPAEYTNLSNKPSATQTKSHIFDKLYQNNNDRGTQILKSRIIQLRPLNSKTFHQQQQEISQRNKTRFNQIIKQNDQFDSDSKDLGNHIINRAAQIKNIQTNNIEQLPPLYFLEIKFDNDEEYIECKQALTDICLIEFPQIQQDFNFVKLIGQGSQAQVELHLKKPAQNLNSSIGEGENNQIINQPEYFAVKKYKMNINDHDYETQIDQLLSELKFIKALQLCENVVQLKRIYYESLTPGTFHISLVLVFAKYGSLLNFIQSRQKLSEETLKTILAQLLLAIDLMHRNNIIHRDIKPDNILLMDRQKMKICITDLGFACKTDNLKEINLKCGTPGYVAPEVLQGKPFTTKCDIFSIGSFFFNILTGQNLFFGNRVLDVLYANQHLNPAPRVQMIAQGVSRECKELLMWMLQCDPQQRPTAEQCLNHQWFSQDREALQGSLFINKNQQLLSKIINENSGFNLGTRDNYASFIYAPNYYENAGMLCSSYSGNMNSNDRISSGNTIFLNVKDAAKSIVSAQGGGLVASGPNSSPSMFSAINLARQLLLQTNKSKDFTIDNNLKQLEEEKEFPISKYHSRSKFTANFGLFPHLMIPQRRNGQQLSSIKSSIQSNGKRQPLHSSNKSTSQNRQLRPRKNSSQNSGLKFCYNQIISKGREHSEQTRFLNAQPKNSDIQFNCSLNQHKQIINAPVVISPIDQENKDLLTSQIANIKIQSKKQSSSFKEQSESLEDNEEEEDKDLLIPCETDEQVNDKERSISIDRKLRQRLHIEDHINNNPEKQMLHINHLQIEEQSIANEISIRQIRNPMISYQSLVKMQKRDLANKKSSMDNIFTFSNFQKINHSSYN